MTLIDDNVQNSKCSCSLCRLACGTPHYERHFAPSDDVMDLHCHRNSGELQTFSASARALIKSVVRPGDGGGVHMYTLMMYCTYVYTDGVLYICIH
jgi:hypothetical protein